MVRARKRVLYLPDNGAEEIKPLQQPPSHPTRQKKREGESNGASSAPKQVPLSFFKGFNKPLQLSDSLSASPSGPWGKNGETLSRDL